MTLLQRRIFLELVGNCVVALVLLLAVLVLVASVEIIAKVEGLGVLEFLGTVPVFLAAAIDLVLPLSVLVAVVMTYGRLAADNEVDAVRASGISPRTLVVPGLLFGLLASVLLLLALDYGKPYAERTKRRVLRDLPMAEMLARGLATGEPVNLDGNTILSIKSLDEQAVAHDVLIQRLDDEGQVTNQIVAETANIYVDIEKSMLVVELHQYTQSIGGGMKGEMWTVERPIARSLVDLNISQLTTPQLVAWLRRAPQERGIFAEQRVAIAVEGRLSGAASCVIFVLLGMPVALRFRRSDRVGAFLVAFLLALFLYYPSVRITKALATRELVPPKVAAWSGNALLLGAGMIFSRRALRR